MNGDHFKPSGFGVGATASLAVAIGAALVSAGNNVADVVAEYNDADDGWDRINAAMNGLLEKNAQQEHALSQQQAAFATLMAQFKTVVELALRQSKQLDALREAGLIS
ncbi:hypothetical protein [Bradyrhizobium sp. S69]|uniref:hypothetical protein n=1 Tax=Bradyrhizobium sp. S69 TaxID=1641856 RepID=UPI00131C45E5|nr:hypothetical protein [Bradyrhizobium sp. S69]